MKSHCSAIVSSTLQAQIVDILHNLRVAHSSMDILTLTWPIKELYIYIYPNANYVFKTRNLTVKGTSVVTHWLSDRGIRSTVFGFKSLMFNGTDSSICGIGSGTNSKKLFLSPDRWSLQTRTPPGQNWDIMVSLPWDLLTSLTAHLLPFLIDMFFLMTY